MEQAASTVHIYAGGIGRRRTYRACPTYIANLANAAHLRLKDRAADVSRACRTEAEGAMRRRWSGEARYEEAMGRYTIVP